jgi:hypothetical protein
VIDAAVVILGKEAFGHTRADVNDLGAASAPAT